MGDAPRSASAPNPPSSRKVPRQPYPSLSAQSTVSVQDDGSPAETAPKSNCEQSFSAPLDLGGQFLRIDAAFVAVLNASAAPNLARFRWVGHHNEYSEREENPRVTAYAACARYKFGDGRLGEVRRAADISAGIAGSRGKFAPSATEKDISALLRRGALGGLGGRSNPFRDISSLRKQGEAIPLKVHQMGHYVLRVIAF